MRFFECLTNDDRFSAPDLGWFAVSDEPRAIELARQHLLADVHHRSLELREGGRLVLSLSRDELGAQ